MDTWGAERSETPLAQLPAGTHLCRFHADRADLAGGAVTFVAGALEAGDRMLYLASERGCDETRASLEEAGVDAGRALAAGQLVLRHSSEVYVEGSGSEEMADAFRAMRDRASADGLAGLRVAAEMGDAVARFGSLPDLLAWEATAARLHAETGIISVCQYARQALSKEEAGLVAAQHDGAAPTSAPPAMACFYVTPGGLRVVGELDVANRPRFLEVVQARLRALPWLQVDLAELAFSDVGTFAELTQLVDRHSGAMVTLKSTPPDLQRRLARTLQHPRVLVF